MIQTARQTQFQLTAHRAHWLTMDAMEMAYRLDLVDKQTTAWAMFVTTEVVEAAVYHWKAVVAVAVLLAQQEKADVVAMAHNNQVTQVAEVVVLTAAATDNLAS